MGAFARGGGGGGGGYSPPNYPPPVWQPEIDVLGGQGPPLFCDGGKFIFEGFGACPRVLFAEICVLLATVSTSGTALLSPSPRKGRPPSPGTPPHCPPPKEGGSKSKKLPLCMRTGSLFWACNQLCRTDDKDTLTSKPFGEQHAPWPLWSSMRSMGVRCRVSWKKSGLWCWGNSENFLGSTPCTEFVSAECDYFYCNHTVGAGELTIRRSYAPHPSTTPGMCRASSTHA